mmetsp:Transcript_19473/g.31143  ORF Transcript_19473/g.31143 Transcript_19473/m.31143 type:complete len:93 (+) Transcript_19473:65-343(+)
MTNGYGDHDLNAQKTPTQSGVVVMSHGAWTVCFEINRFHSWPEGCAKATPLRESMQALRLHLDTTSSASQEFLNIPVCLMGPPYEIRVQIPQ